ncbi:MAG: PDZ domain-containing protein [Phycisphaeraceae bacterium]|nr:PDZ domain-containing protein [Phycisphaeraceae bacterium]
MRRWTLVLVLAVLTCMTTPALRAAARGDDDSPKARALAEVGASLAPSLVQVEITGQYDKGEAPGQDRMAMWRAYYSAIDSSGGVSESNELWEELIKQERPRSQCGYLVSPTRVYTSDPMLDPRFIKSIQVRFGDRVVDAKPAAYPLLEHGLFLDLAEPLPDTKPLVFDPSKPGPYYTVSYGRSGGIWATRVNGLRAGVLLTDDGRRLVPNPIETLVVSKDGVPVALTGSGGLDVDDAWKVDPSQWKAETSAGMDSAIERVRAASARGVLRAQLLFRSPRVADGEASRYGRYMPRGDESETMTEWNGSAVLVNDTTVLVLASLKPKVTARLEKIRLFTADGQELAATFSGSLKDWGAIVATLGAPTAGAVTFSTAPIRQIEDRLLIKSEVAVKGETRIEHLWRDRIDGFFTGHRGDVFPNMSGSRESMSSYYGRGDTNPALNFLYTLDGSLVGVPMERRERVAADDQYSRGYSLGSSLPTLIVPAAQVTAVLDAGSASIDQDNRPLSEEQEKRLAWLGIEMQGMDPELARANGVTEQTNGGRSGGMVTFVYEGSPAAAAGIEVGTILLRLHIEGQPKPLEVSVTENPLGAMGDQFWQYLDRVPEEYFDSMPQPWGNAETPLTRALTDIGFGTPFTADVFRDGKVEQVGFTVTEGPSYYGSAARIKSEELGLSARDLTYEVRRYFQIKPDEPGVIVAKVEGGTKAAVAGIKPYEIIRSINDEPIRNVGDLEAAIKKGGELRIAVKRMTKGRTVKITLGAKDKEPIRDTDDEPAPANAGN